MNVVIMAGGGGTRLWPLSVRNNPKQFVDLGTGKSLLAHAYDRATRLTNPENIYVATAAGYGDKTKEILPGIPAERMFLEPARRDTTAAFVHVCARLQQAGKGDEPTTFLWSDHIFTDEEAFLKDLSLAPSILEQHPDSLVIMGHVPLNPNTMLGYFRVMGEQVSAPNVHKVETFIEKPDKETAESFVARGGYFWNLGYFSLKPSYLLSKLPSVSPEFAEPIQTITTAAESNDEQKLRDAFEDFPKAALEKTFVEKIDSIIAITGDYGWSDVGNWATVKELFGQEGSAISTSKHFHVDSENNFIYNKTDKAVSLVGLDNAIVVVTDKAVLVCDIDSAPRVKEVVERIEKDGKGEYL